MKRRYERIDNLRAFSIISMVLYHGMWDLVYLYNFNWNWYKETPGFIWQQSICWCFILISGFCHSMSRNGFKNSMRVFLAGILVSAVTWIVMPTIRISFGILTLIGSAGLICCLLDKPLKKVKPELGLILFAALFALTRAINGGYLGFGEFRIFELSRDLYANYFTAYLGLPPKGYFSLLPWLNLYICGFYLHKIFCKHNLMHLLHGRECKFFSFLSKRSLLIYLLHQPLLSGLFYLIF